MKAKDIVKSLGGSVRDSFMVDPRSLVIEEGFNFREMNDPENEEHLQYLMRSIKAVGVKNPIVVRCEDGKIMVVSGHMRTISVLRLIEAGHDIKAIPAVLESGSVTEEERTAQQLVYNGGKAQSHIEKGKLFAKLQNVYGWTIDRMAEQTGMSAVQIENILNLHSAPTALKETVTEGKLSASNAEALVREEGGKKGAEIATKAVKLAESLGHAKATERHIKAVKDGKTNVAPITRPRKASNPANGEVKISSDAKFMLDAFVDICKADSLEKAQQIAKDVLENYGRLGEVAA